MPLAFVIAVAVGEPLKAALAPVEGAANVTVTPLTGLLFASFTVACSAVANAVVTVALCELPAVAVMLPELPAVFNARMIVATCGLPIPFQVAL